METEAVLLWTCCDESLAEVSWGKVWLVAKTGTCGDMEGNALGLWVVCGTDKNTIRSSSGDFPIISERVGYCLNFKRSLPGGRGEGWSIRVRYV